MKSATFPPLRVSPELRKEVESMLEEGETLSSFVLQAVSRSIEVRRARQAFLERGLASAERAKKTGDYVSASTVVRRLTRRLSKARAKRA